MIHASQGSPFYAQRFRASGIDPQRVDSIRDLDRLPVLQKSEIRAAREDMVVPGSAVVESCTSGSSGSPLIFDVCPRRLEADVAARIRAHQWFNLNPGDPMVYLWGARIEADAQDRFKTVRDWLINETLLNAFELSDERLLAYARVLLNIRPEAMYSYASTLWRLATFVSQACPELRGAVGRVAFATGECVRPDWREAIEAGLGCRVAEEYGCREGGLIAHECDKGTYHLSAENVVVEIVGDDDTPVATGCDGRIIITNLQAFGMPFIRYDTGDRGHLRHGGCACGRGLPTMGRPTGRSFEFLEASDGTRITGVSISRDLKEIPGIAHYRVVQEARDRVRVLVVRVAGDERPEIAGEVAARIRARLGESTRVELQECDELPAIASGKYRYVLNAMDEDAPGCDVVLRNA
jgi:phenylacetate-CoA ligase